MNVNRNDFLLAEVTWSTGFKHKMSLRGFNLKSWIEFHKSLSHVTDFNWWIVTEDVYNDYLYGEKDESRGSETKTLKKNPAKRKPRKAANKDSEVSRSASGRRTSASKKERTELREPKVRNVRKPKASVARTDSSGTKTLPRTRSSKGSKK